MTDNKDKKIIAVRLTPKAARNAVLGWVNDETGTPVLKASVTAIPENGKANKALIALLAKSWKIPKTSIHLIKGETARNKIIAIDAPLPPEARPPSR